MGNKSRNILFAVMLVAAFLAGGWVFRQMPNLNHPKGEVEEMYSKDGESLGIFDKVSEEDMAEAAAIAAAGLKQQIVLPEDTLAQNYQDGTKVPTQINITDLSEIASVVSKKPEVKTSVESAVEKKEDKVVNIELSGDEKVGHAAASLPKDGQDNSHISFIVAPVKYLLVKNTGEYKAFKTRARGAYPDVNFNKQMVVVLESDSNLPDNVFEIISVEKQADKLLVSYRVNVLGLEHKLNTHAAIAVDKTDLPVELKQVL
ncbi:MAG: hypothetical protein IKC13_04825 [Elusimicrobiaceae bacterium]|nr:hypothetical protein [Elusimicrobiaceae bacterium]